MKSSMQIPCNLSYQFLARKKLITQLITGLQNAMQHLLVRLNSQSKRRKRWTSLQKRAECDWSVGGLETCGNPPRDVWALQRLENLIATKHWGIEVLLVTITDLTAFRHVPIPVLFWNWIEHDSNVALLNPVSVLYRYHGVVLATQASSTRILQLTAVK